MTSPPNPKPLRRDDLTALDLMVMEALTTSRTTISVVALAATLWNPDGQMGADPVGLVEYLVRELGERGLLTYRLEAPIKGVHNPYSGLPHTIRLTQDGWALMGYPIRHMEVGSITASHARLDDKGDRTNYRKHSTTAEGVGPIEKMPWHEHRVVYPDHRHPLMEGEPDVGMKNTASPKLAPVEDGDPVTRGYIKVTPELEARVIAYRTRFPLVDYRELADMCDLPERSIRYILTDLPRLRATNDAEQAAGTIKQRILWVLDALPMNNVPELRRVLGRADTEHDIVHALHDLHKLGKVDFREDGAHKQPVDIHLTARGRGEGLPKVVKDRIADDMKVAAGEDEPLRLDNLDGTTSVTVTDSEPKQDEPEYPLLAALLAREQERVNADNTYFKFSEAADLIREADPETAALLDQKAQNHDIPLPSPIEAEYIKFFRNTPMKVVERE